MAINIRQSKKLENSNLDIHYLPFKVKADCEAKTEKFFNSTIRTEETGALTASFRGYPLNGAKIDVPTGYQGVLLHESVKPLTEDEKRKFYVIHKFKDFTCWNWDKLPSKNDTIQQALQWIHVAEALHGPIEEEEMKS